MDRDLLTFDPIAALSSADPVTRADGERLLAHHVRLMVLACAPTYLQGSPLPVSFFDCNFDGPAKYLSGRGLTSIYSEQSLAAYLQSSLQQGVIVRPTLSTAAAHLLSLYLALIPDRLSSKVQTAQYELGIFGYLAPKLWSPYGDQQSRGERKDPGFDLS